MLKKILLTIFKPNHEPEMNLAHQDAFEQPTGEALAVELINKFWVKNKSANAKQAKAMIKNVAEKMLEDCRKVFASPDPVLLNRQLLAESVLQCAKLQVLIISPQPEYDASGLRGHLGITGELKAKILEILKIDKEFESFPDGLSSEQAWNQVQYAYRRAWANMNLFEGIRHEYDDIHEEQEKDWFRPFFASQCAYSESKFREALGMSNELDKISVAGTPAGLLYGKFKDTVLNGDKYPDIVWEEKYPDLVNPKIIWSK
jgi:hypothetical protein